MPEVRHTEETFLPSPTEIRTIGSYRILSIEMISRAAAVDGIKVEDSIEDSMSRFA